MLIVGTGGHALDTYNVLMELNRHHHVSFFNNVEEDFQFDIHQLKHHPILFSEHELIAHFKTNPDYVLGIGNPERRKKMDALMLSMGGKPYTLMSPNAVMGKLNNTVANCVSLMTGVVVTSNVSIGYGTLINTNATVTHDCRIGSFVEISPGVKIAGKCTIEDDAFIGIGASILPNINIGKGAVIAAGAIVIKDVPAYTMVAGNPAVIKKSLKA